MLIKRKSRKHRTRREIPIQASWKRRRAFNKKVEIVEAAFLQDEVEQPGCITTHHFSPGVYVRELFMPAGSLIVGHEHRTEHMNIVLTGSATVMCGEEVDMFVKAGDVFKSGIGVRKVLHIHEDMRWITTHATNKTTVDEVEDEIFRKSKTFLRVCGGIKAMNATELREKQKQLNSTEGSQCLVG